jgi:hypothetical protein
MQTNGIEHQVELDDAVDELKRHFVGLAGLVAERLKTGAREAIDETVETAKQKASELFSTEEVRSMVRSHPRAAVLSAFGVGAFVGLGKSSRLRSSIVAMLGLGFELFRSSANFGLTSDSGSEPLKRSSKISIH